MKRFGVFAWNDCGVYRPAAAVKTFKLEHAARRHADKLNNAITDYPINRRFVVRSFHVAENEQPAIAGSLAW